MSARVDNRPVLERLADLVDAAEFDSTHGEPLARCDCGATLRKHVGPFTVCAGCGLAPSYQLHLATTSGEGAACHAAPWERGVPPETSAGKTQSAKDADAPDGSSVSLGSGVLGRVGYALRSLKSSVNWGIVWGTVVTVAFWTTLGYTLGTGL